MMKLRDCAVKPYLEEEVGCSTAILIGARDALGLEVTEPEIVLMNGFRGGMGCGATCGALSGSIAVLSKRYAGREDIKEICGAFVEAFRSGMKGNSTDCSVLKGMYHRDDDQRCAAAVRLAADLLEAFIDKLDGTDRSREVDKEGCTVSAADIKRVKGEGFLNHKGTNKFNGRIITRNGRITAQEAAKMAEVCEKYGDGHMMLTTRLTVEISGVDYENIDAFQKDIAEVGLITGGTGSKVRPVVSCKGTTCQYGLYDTYRLSEEAHERFYVGYHNVSLPHKFKIAFGGCPNNCVKPNLNDLGVIGARVPAYEEEKCLGCKKCQIEAACPIKVAKVENGKLNIDPAACNNCGRCVGKCPFKCIEDGTYGYKIYIGGRWGKRVAAGQMLNHLFKTEQEVLDTIEKAILLFRSEGISGERFADTINRIGFEKAEAMLLSDDLLQRKNEILGLDVVGGASC